MFSALANADKSSFYDFYLMVPGKFSKENEKRILKLKKQYNCDIHFISLKDKFKDIKMSIPHISYVTYFRLLAGDLLPQKYNKCLYIDTDICVCSDLYELYSSKIENNYVAGVIAATYLFSAEKNCERLKLPSVSSYINAGVLLMNLKQIRKDNMTQKFISMIANNYQSQDQDIINVSCYKKIAILPLKFNLMTKYPNLWKRDSEGYKRLQNIYGDNNIQQAIASPVIIHYANPEKPWNNKKLPLADIWWKYANMTKIFNKKFIHIKPYIFFPYYLLAILWMKFIYIPILKFIKHSRAIRYSHSYRGKIDILNTNVDKILNSVQTIKNDIQKKIDIINNQQNDLIKLLNNNYTNIKNQLDLLQNKFSEHEEKELKPRKTKTN